MRIVIDTNVLVSALLNPDRVPAQVWDLVPSGKVTCLYDDRILAEYIAVLAKPKLKIDPAKAIGVIALLKMAGEEIEGPFPQIQLPDKSDEKFLEVAWAGLANALVTGNGKHSPARRAGLVKIMSPKEFLDRSKQGKN